MTVAIVEPRDLSSWNDEQLDNFLSHFFEAMRHEKKTGFVTRVVLKRFDKNNLPIYEKIPDGVMTWVEEINDLSDTQMRYVHSVR